MKLKPEWKGVIVLLEKEITNLEKSLAMMNVHGMTKTEVNELMKKQEDLILPYKIMLQRAKYTGYELTLDERRQNAISPIFRI